jgi:drug/metabolite transporter (DMT)-like permease
VLVATFNRGDERGSFRETRLFATIEAAFVVFIWGTSWVLVKIGLRDLSPLGFAGLRYLFGFVALLPILLGRPAIRRSLRQLSWRDWRRLGLLGLLLYCVTHAATFVALTHLPAVTVSLLQGLAPVLVALLAVWRLGESLVAAQWLGIALSVLGTALYLEGPRLRIGVHDLPALGIVLISVGAFAGATIVGRAVNREPHLPPLLVTTVSMGIGSVCLVIIAFASEGIPRLQPSNWRLILWLALVNTAFAYLLWNHTMRRLTAVESSLINNTLLIHVALLAWLFLGERLSMQAVVGLLLVAGGVALVQLRLPARTAFRR